MASVQHLGEGGSVEAASPALPQAPGAPGTPMRVLTQLLGVEVRSSRDRAEGEEGSSPHLAVRPLARAVQSLFVVTPLVPL